MKKLLLVLAAIFLAQSVYAQTNFYSGTNSVAVGTSSPTSGTALDLGSNTNSLLLPVGTDGSRPTGVNGMLRYNSTTPAVEGYINNAWTPLAGGGGGGFTSCTQVSGSAGSPTSTATCAAGYTLTGGGGNASCTGFVYGVSSYPSASDTWTFSENAVSGCSNVAYAICCH